MKSKLKIISLKLLLIAIFYRPRLNQDILIDVVSTEDMNFITYQVLGRGDIIISRTLSVGGQKKYNFQFLASFAMVPKANIVVYYIRADGEIISDSIKLELGSELQNYVSRKMTFLE
jgi:CD109 antigen